MWYDYVKFTLAMQLGAEPLSGTVTNSKITTTGQVKNRLLAGAQYVNTANLTGPKTGNVGDTLDYDISGKLTYTTKYGNANPDYSFRRGYRP